MGLQIVGSTPFFKRANGSSTPVRRSPEMTARPEFADVAGQLLRTVADDLARQAAGRVACDLAGDVLSLRFADGAKCTLIRQTPTDQIWLSDGVLAWYFDWQPDTGGWTDGRGRGPLATILRDVLERRLGSPLELALSPAPSDSSA